MLTHPLIPGYQDGDVGTPSASAGFGARPTSDHLDNDYEDKDYDYNVDFDYYDDYDFDFDYRRTSRGRPGG